MSEPITGEDLKNRFDQYFTGATGHLVGDTNAITAARMFGPRVADLGFSQPAATAPGPAAPMPIVTKPNQP